jgi:hypothetical protein
VPTKFITAVQCPEQEYCPFNVESNLYSWVDESLQMQEKRLIGSDAMKSKNPQLHLNVVGPDTSPIEKKRKMATCRAGSSFR